MSLKQYIFDYLRKKQPERDPRFPHLDRPLKILIIYESDVLERNDSIKSIRQDLLRRQMDVTMWGYVEKKEIQTLILPQSRILGTGDYNLFGKPRDYVLNDLTAEHYDLLIDLLLHIHLVLKVSLLCLRTLRGHVTVTIREASISFTSLFIFRLSLSIKFLVVLEVYTSLRSTIIGYEFLQTGLYGVS